jgi:hypothetical protein
MRGKNFYRPTVKKLMTKNTKESCLKKGALFHLVVSFGQG